MRALYIAGPFMAETAFEIAGNVRAAEAVGLEVAKAGCMPMIPHANTASFHDQPIDVQHWYEGTLELMRRCDGVVCLPTWHLSKGARGEKAEAEALGMPVHVYDNPASLRDWLDDVATWHRPTWLGWRMREVARVARLSRRAVVKIHADDDVGPEDQKCVVVDVHVQKVKP